MKAFARLAVFSLLLCCSKMMLADSFQVNGSASFDQVNFVLAPPFSNGTDTGVFSTLAAGTFYYWLGTTPYIYGVPATELAFTLKTDAHTLNFYDQVNDPSKSLDAHGNLVVTLHETGYYIFDGGPEVAGYFDAVLTGDSPNGATSFGQFLGNGGFSLPEDLSVSAVAPEPNTILFLGTGLLAMAVLLRGHQRKQKPARVRA